MRPKCLCFAYIGKKGVEKIRLYPEVLNKSDINKITHASFPFDTQQNNFITSITDKFFIASLLFTINHNTSLISALLIAIYEGKILSKPEELKEYFLKTLEALSQENKLDVSTIANTLPNIYDNLKSTVFQTNVEGSITLEIFTSKKKKIKLDEVDIFNEDIWGKFHRNKE